MTITATSILSSVSDDGNRIDTLLLRYPRFIHAEFMTHRVFSRNASSSRAIPVGRLIRDVERDPAYPIYWGKNQSGMQADTELSGRDRTDAIQAWTDAKKNAIRTARIMAEIDAHKQVVNRVLEPFSHINVVVTSTEWKNFFDLRMHRDAQPEIRQLAVQMNDAIRNSNPNELEYGQWHLPFVTDEEIEAHGGLTDPHGKLRIISSARCARTSYKTHDGRVSSFDEDLSLGRRLTNSEPFHASPFEHQATPFNYSSRNFVGWRQYRYFLEHKKAKG